ASGLPCGAFLCLFFVRAWRGGVAGPARPLLPVALGNRVVRCRRGALTVLADWPPEARPPEARGWVAAAAEREPDPELRRDMLAFSET
ncbi:hypothetical protein, partial [Nocardia asiatica]|uniref:hypothetical protein n=1 Tax=Nocardia asiatica TaxID=209252 RepID=UPI0024546A25